MKTQINLNLLRGKLSKSQIRKFSTSRPLKIEPGSTTAFLGITPDTTSGKWALVATIGFIFASTIYRHFPHINLFQEVDEVVLPIPGFGTDMYFRRINSPVWQEFMQNQRVFIFESQHIWSRFWYPELDLDMGLNYIIRLQRLIYTTQNSVLRGDFTHSALRVLLDALHNMDTIHTRTFRALCVCLQKIDETFPVFYEEYLYLLNEAARLGKKLWVLIRMIQDILGDLPTFRRFFERLWLFDPDRNVDQIRNLEEVIEHVLDRDVAYYHCNLYEYLYHGFNFVSFIVEDYL